MTSILLWIVLLASPAPAAPPLPSLLDLAARAAEREIGALGAVTCTETVVETKVNQKDKTEERRRQMFDYLVLMDTDDGGLSINESRVEKEAGNGKKEASKPLLVSTGFSTLLLILHPFYQSSFEFTDLGTVEEGGHAWRRLGFQFRPGKRSPSVLRTGAREFPLAWQGEIRMDAATGEVASIHASLGKQLEEVGLESLEATVHYASLPQGWLPVEADIDLKTRHQHWHNVHTFDKYKRFGVDATEKTEVPK